MHGNTTRILPTIERAAWQAPSKYFERRMFTNGELLLPDGARMPYWGFEDPLTAPGAKSFPSPIIRVHAGELTHVKLETMSDAPARPAATCKSAWTTKAPAPLAVQRSESFIYQWQPTTAGTWLYQGHTSSPLNFEMGLFGLLIVDPVPEADGRQRAYRGGPVYDIEQCWIIDDIDPSWHDLPAGEVQSKAKTAPRPFNPAYFMVNGIANTEIESDPAVAIEAQLGETVLIRLLNASFSLIRVKFDGLPSSIISVDGNPLASEDRPWTKWSEIKSSQPVYMATGARHDILINLDPTLSGAVRGQDYRVTIEFLDWEKRTVRNGDARNPLNAGRATTRIRVV